MLDVNLHSIQAKAVGDEVHLTILRIPAIVHLTTDEAKELLRQLTVAVAQP